MLTRSLLCDLLFWLLNKTRDARIGQIDLISKKIAYPITWILSIRSLFVEANTRELPFESMNKRDRSELVKEVLFCSEQLRVINISVLRIFDVIKLLLGEMMLLLGYLLVKIDLNFKPFRMKLLDEVAFWVA